MILIDIIPKSVRFRCHPGQTLGHRAAHLKVAVLSCSGMIWLIIRVPPQKASILHSYCPWQLTLPLTERRRIVA